MEELNLSFEFAIFVPTHRAIRTHCDDILQQRIHGDPLHHFLMSIECLYLRELPLTRTPQYGSSVDRARHEAAGVPRPAYVHDVPNMPPELAGMPPLHGLL